MTEPLVDAPDGSWPLGPFQRWPGHVVTARAGLSFECPVSGSTVAWAAKDVFNPGAVVHEGRVCLLVRGEDREGRYAGTSRIGLATSSDGYRFEVEAEPVIFPADDQWQPWEWPGGCEDPRVVESPDGGFVCLYTAFDGKGSALSAATSADLRSWVKHGPVFSGTPLARRYSKSGSVVTEVRDGRLVAARLRGRYWMYWGEGTAFMATSEDLLQWEPVDFDPGSDRWLALGPQGQWSVNRVTGTRTPRPVLFPRPGRFDSLLVEPGPPAVMTDDGIVLVYNGANHPDRGDPSIGAYAYRPGQALFDPLEPGSCISRTRSPFLSVADDTERSGQVDDVVFAQGLVRFEGRWLLYAGLADSRIACFTATAAGS